LVVEDASKHTQAPPYLPFLFLSSYRYHWCGCRSHTNIGPMFYELLVFKNPNGRAPMSDDLPVLPVRLLDSLSVGPTWACQHKNSGFSNFRWDAFGAGARYERCRSALQFRDSDTRPLCVLDDLLELRFRYYERTCYSRSGSRIQDPDAAFRRSHIHLPQDRQRLDASHAQVEHAPRLQLHVQLQEVRWFALSRQMLPFLTHRL